jgi:hypothetical protein
LTRSRPYKPRRSRLSPSEVRVADAPLLLEPRTPKLPAASWRKAVPGEDRIPPARRQTRGAYGPAKLFADPSASATRSQPRGRGPKASERPVVDPVTNAEDHGAGCALSAQGRGAGLTHEMLVAQAKQVSVAVDDAARSRLKRSCRRGCDRTAPPRGFDGHRRRSAGHDPEQINRLTRTAPCQ